MALERNYTSILLIFMRTPMLYIKQNIWSTKRAWLSIVLKVNFWFLFWKFFDNTFLRSFWIQRQMKQIKDHERLALRLEITDWTSRIIFITDRSSVYFISAYTNFYTYFVNPGKPNKTRKTILCCYIVFVFIARTNAAREAITEMERRSLP